MDDEFNPQEGHNARLRAASVYTYIEKGEGGLNYIKAVTPTNILFYK